VIVWVNGTFGAGKTSVGTLAVERDPRLRLYDPECVGYLLRGQLSDQEFTDFQQLESWRRLVPVVADELIRETGHHLVAIQTVLIEDFWVELVAGLSALGHEVLHVVVEADEDVMRERIDVDRLEPGAREWRLNHLERYAAARDWMTRRADLVLDTTALTPAQATDEFWRALDERLSRPTR